MRDAKNTPHRVRVSAHHFLHHGRDPPQCPVRQLAAPHGLRFTVEFMQQVAEYRGFGCEFLGVLYAGDSPTFDLSLPQNGVDIVDVPMYWRLNEGRVVCWSVEQLIRKTEADIKDADDANVYQAVGEELGFRYLGAVYEKAFMKPFLEDPGELRDKRWGNVSFFTPPDSLSPCWWLTNPRAEDCAAPKCLERCLALLLAELRSKRVATVTKLVEERVRRVRSNLEVQERVEGNPFARAVPELFRQMLSTPTASSISEFTAWVHRFAEDVPESDEVG